MQTTGNSIQRVEDGQTVTYRWERARCGNEHCKQCRDSGDGHGPYLYRYAWVNGKTQKRYVAGQTAPGQEPDAYRTCENPGCNEKLTRKNQRFCSPRCRVAWHRQQAKN